MAVTMDVPMAKESGSMCAWSVAYIDAHGEGTDLR
jgi:hypothetical protein